MSFPIASARLNSATVAFLRLIKRPPAHEVIRFYKKDGGNCVCLVVQRKIGRKRHVAFISMAGSPSDPSDSVEGLASFASRDLGAPATSLTFWYVNRDQWEHTTIRRVEFQAFTAGKFSEPKWIPEAMPDALTKQVARAEHAIFPNWTATAPGGRR